MNLPLDVTQMCLVHGSVWGTLAGVMVSESVILARRMGKYRRWWRFVQLCSGASNRRKAGKGPGHDMPPILLALLWHVFQVHIVISTYTEN